MPLNNNIDIFDKIGFNNNPNIRILVLAYFSNIFNKTSLYSFKTFLISILNDRIKFKFKFLPLF